ncbi:MAG: hypothetical protein GXP37_07410 [Chloroflexi bacterium]|nr:hypothetical protein [Chloroflexota bacterium]
MDAANTRKKEALGASVMRRSATSNLTPKILPHTPFVWQQLTPGNDHDKLAQDQLKHADTVVCPLAKRGGILLNL